MQSKPETIDTVLAHPAELSEDARERLEKFVEEEEGAFNRLGGWVGVAIAAFAIFVSLFHLYAAYEIVPAHVLRPTHVGMVLVLCFLLFPVAARFRDRIRWWDYLLAAASAGTMLYVLSQGAYFGDRATAPTDDGLDRRRDLHRAAAGGDAPLHRLHHAGRRHLFRPLRPVRQVSAAAVDASRLSRSRISSPTST